MKTGIIGHCCFFLILYSVLELHKRFLQIFFGFVLMEYASSCFRFLRWMGDDGSEFFISARFSQVYVFALFLVFGFGMRVFQSNWKSKGLYQTLCDCGRKSCDFGNEVFSKVSLCDVIDSRMMGFNFKRGPYTLKLLGNPSPRTKTKALMSNDLWATTEIIDAKQRNVTVGEDGVNEKEHHDEDQMFDVLVLRKLLKVERQRVEETLAELEKERLATASAADEAMAMILKLQREKSFIEIEATNFKRLAEQKQQYDQQVIQSLCEVVKEQETERKLLECELNIYRKKLKECVKDGDLEFSEEMEQNLRFSESRIEEALRDVYISSLDMDLSP